MPDKPTYPGEEAGADAASAPASGIKPELAATETADAATPTAYDTIAGRPTTLDAPAPAASGGALGGSDTSTEPVATPARRDVLHFPEANSDTAEQAEPETSAKSVGDDKADSIERYDEEILFQRQFCIRGKGSDCSRCEMACPAGAISFDDQGWPQIDANTCTRCGICYGVCDAFTSSRVNIIDLRERARRMAALDGIIYVTCRENIFADTELAPNVLAVPCLAALPPEFFASVMAEGARLIVAGNLNYCDDCRVAGDRGSLMYDYAFQTAEAWTGKSVEFVDEVPEQKDLIERINQDSRRDAITGLLSVVGEVASGRYRNSGDAVADFEAMREQMHASPWTDIDYDHPLYRATHQPGKFKTMFPRREFLLETAQADWEIARNITVAVSDTDPGRCTCNFDCVRACITGARGIDDDDLLTFDARYCIGCGLCLDACQQGACFMRETTAAQLGEEQRVADDDQVRAMMTARAAAMDDDHHKTAFDADAIFGAVEAPDSWA